MARLAILIAASMLALPAVADAQLRRPRIAVLEVQDAGGLQDPLRARMADRLVAAMRARGVDAIDQETLTTALAPLGPSLAGTCRAGQCVRWILDVVDADGGLVAAVSAVESSYTVTLVVLGPDGDEIDRVRRRCDICTFEELEASVVAGVGQLDIEIPRRLRMGRIGVVPEPGDARVEVDGVAVGVGPVSVPAAVGEHRVEALLEGHLPAARTVEVEPEQTTRVELRLRPGSPPRPPVPPRRLDPTPWLWTTIGAGAAIAVAGGMLLAIGSTCLEPGLDGVCLREADQTPLGSGMLAGGLAAAVVSAVTLTILSLTAD